MLRHVKIRYKLLLLNVLAILSLLVFGLVSFNTMNSLNSHALSSYKNSLLPIEWLETMCANNNAISSDLVQMTVTKGDQNIQSLKQDIDARENQNNTYMSDFEKTNLDAYQKKAVANYKNVLAKYRTARQDVVILVQAGDAGEALTDFQSTVAPLQLQVNNLIKSLGAYAEQNANSENQANTKSYHQTLVTTSAIFVVSILIFVCIGLLISRSIEKPVKEIQTLMKLAEEGDLSVHGKNHAKDEIGQLTQSFNSMIQSVQMLISEVRESSLTLAATSEELSSSAAHTGKATEKIAATIQEVATNSDAQVRTVEDTVVTIQTMSEHVEEIADRTRRVMESSVQASEISMQGNDTIQKTVTQMNSIQATVIHAAKDIHELGEQTQHIGKIVEVITGLSSQTNLLALNAAIEAARAGEHGRGFAVVADEVRKLAEESANSAKRITDYILLIEEKIRTVVQSMEQGKKEVETGIQVVHGAGVSFEEIQASVIEVTTQLKEVAGSVDQLAVGAKGIVEAVHTMADTSEQSAAGTQTVSAATEEQLASMEEITVTANSLSNMADQLQKLISRFKI